jgi:hypothetical protein
MKVKINGKYYINFNNLAISQKLDSVASSFSFTTTFNPEDDNHKELVRPFAFHKVEIYNDEDMLFLTGVIVNQSFKSSAKPQDVSLSGYSLAGVLEDCTLAYSDYPLEMNDLTLRQIIQRMIKKFGLRLYVDSSVAGLADKVYEKAVAEVDETVKSFISKLTSQRNIILGHNPQGDLVLFRPRNTGEPRYSIIPENGIDMSLDISGQGIHSHIWMTTQPTEEDYDVERVDLAVNPMVSAFRPLVKKATSGEEVDNEPGASNVMADELKNIKFKLKLDRWLILDCGNIIELMNPEIYLPNRTRLMVQGMQFFENTKGRTMEIDLVLPETFSGAKIKNLF